MKNKNEKTIAAANTAAKGKIKTVADGENVLAIYNGASLKRAVAAVRKTGARVKVYTYCSSTPVRLNGEGARVVIEGRFGIGAIYTPAPRDGVKDAHIKTTLARVFAGEGYKPSSLGGKTRADAEKRAREIELLFKAAWSHSAETPLDDLAKSL